MQHSKNLEILIVYTNLKRSCFYMPRFPKLGSKVSNFRGMGTTGMTQLYTIKDQWIIVYASPRHTTKYGVPLIDHYRGLATENIEILVTPTSSRHDSIYIIDPNYTLKAILHDTPSKPITQTSISDLIQSLSSNYRPQIQSIDNQPINPKCPDVRQIVGEYVLGDPRNVDPYLLDFAIYAFGLIQPDGSIDVYSKRYLRELADLRFANPRLKVIMAIGGWGNEGFSDAALTPKSRFDFAREVKRWVDEYRLDGVDIDWEYPGSSVAGITSRPEDKENFTLLLQALREVLGPQAWLSVAGVGSKEYINNVEINKIAPIIDYFNLMSYDFTAGLAPPEGLKHHSNLFTSDLSLPNTSADIYIQNLIEAGMPAKKILMGIGFYGRQGATRTVTFDEIRRSYLNRNGYRVNWDNVAKAPYIVDRNGNFAYSFDSELSIYFKAQYADDHCLGGLFGWQSNMDTANILLNAMHLGIKSPGELEKILRQQFLGE